ncbi:hypothetical protein SKB0120_01700 [Moraxella osloensis]
MFKKNNKATDHEAQQSKRSAQPRKQKNTAKKRHVVAKLIGVGVTATAATGVTAVLGSYGAWQYAKQQYRARRLYTPAFSGVVTNQHFKGKVHKVGEYLTFVTDGATYALNDPLLRIQSLYQSNKTPTDNQASHQTKLIDRVHCDDVTIVAELSEKGHYGYLGHLDYQLTVVDTADDAMNF